jgi:hypothetical protein
METADSQLWAQHAALSEAAAGSSAAHSAAIRHYLGGPVGLPSRTGPASHTVVLHHMPAVPGASKLITAATGQQQQEIVQQPDTAAAQDQQQQQQQQQQAIRRLPAWQKMLKACSSTGRRQTLQQQQVLAAAPSELSSSAASVSATLSTLSLYQGGSMDVLLQAVLQANTAAATAAAAAPGSGFASKLRWPLHPRGSANRHQLNRHTTNNNQQQQQQQQTGSGSSSNSNPGQSRQQQQQLSQVELAAVAASLRMYHGVCVWGPGQLEGEVRSGAWGVAAAELSDVVATPPQLLWENLTGSNRARWF